MSYDSQLDLGVKHMHTESLDTSDGRLLFFKQVQHTGVILIDCGYAC